MSNWTEFTPFDDSQQVIYIPTDEDTGGSNTSEIDPYRQGVEIRTNRQRFFSTQPKIWAGDFDHAVNTNVIGQARSFVEYDNTLLYTDLPEFNPVSYIELGPDYPLPIVFNNGPQQEEETAIEPITIPFRKNSNEGPFFAHRVAGVIEDGNDFDTIFKNANRTTQFVDYDAPMQQRYFLDEGQTVWSNDLTTGIGSPGYISGGERTLRAFNDTTIDDIPESVRGVNTTLLNVLLQLDMNQNQDMRPARTKSANANTFVYGRDAAIYGTDSIAFLGLTRGT